MVNRILILFSLLIFLVILSCSQSIDTNKIINSESDFQLNFLIKGVSGLDSTIRISINKDSKEIKGLKNWIDSNTDGWSSSIASYAMPEISLTSEHFRLLIFKDFVVIGYIDSSGKSRQFTKKSNMTDFKFIDIKKERTPNNGS